MTHFFKSYHFWDTLPCDGAVRRYTSVLIMIYNAINEVLIARFQQNDFLRLVLVMLLEVFSVFSPDTGALLGGLTCVR